MAVNPKHHRKGKKKMIRKTTLTLGSLICSVFFLSMYSLAAADTVPKFTIYTENYKPYNFEKDGKIQGIAVELLTQMLEKTGSSQTLTDIKLVPWARGYDAVQKNEKTLLFSTARTEEREDLFKWVCPIKTITEELWALKSKNIKLNTLKDAAKYRIGTLRNDVGEQLVVSRCGVPVDKLQRANKYEFNVKKLMAGRIDLFPMSHISLTVFSKELGLDINKFESVFVLNTSHLCFAFSKDTSDDVIAKFQKALDELIEAGAPQQLTKKYME